jgi:hypothetical protein
MEIPLKIIDELYNVCVHSEKPVPWFYLQQKIS